MSGPEYIPLPARPVLDDVELVERAARLRATMDARRSVRNFSNRPVPKSVIDDLLRIAGSAPSGANLQPWHFVAISDPAVKKEIRIAAEEEEREFYEHRAPKEWLEALTSIGTDSHKPFLETAPWLIAVFAQPFRILPDGTRMKHYYASESVGIASGLLVSAIHQAGLASLTHTPSPMAFLNRILQRPPHEKPFLLLVISHPAIGARVPDIERNPLKGISTFI